MTDEESDGSTIEGNPDLRRVFLVALAHRRAQQPPVLHEVEPFGLVVERAPRALDDNTFAALNQLQFFNNVQIISSLTNDAPFLQGLRAKLTAEPVDPDELLYPLAASVRPNQFPPKKRGLLPKTISSQYEEPQKR